MTGPRRNRSGQPKSKVALAVEARQEQEQHFRVYNQRRTHQGLARRTPNEAQVLTNGLRKAARELATDGRR